MRGLRRRGFDVEAADHHMWPLSPRVRVIHLRLNSALLSRHEREVVVTVNDRKNPVSGLLAHYF